MGGRADRGLGERILPGDAAEVRTVLRPGWHEMLLSARERNVLRGRGREGGHRGYRISGTARPSRPRSAQACGHPVGTPPEHHTRAVEKAVDDATTMLMQPESVIEVMKKPGPFSFEGPTTKCDGRIPRQTSDRRRRWHGRADVSTHTR